jgi:hypothetical protein
MASESRCSAAAGPATPSLGEGRCSEVAAFSRLPSVMSQRQIAVRGTPGGTECD